MNIVKQNKSRSDFNQVIELYIKSLKGKKQNYPRIVKKYLQYLIDNDFETGHNSRDNFLLHLKAKGVKSLTLYKSVVRHFNRFAFDNKIHFITASKEIARNDNFSNSTLIQRFLNDLDVKPHTKKTYENAIYQYNRFCLDNQVTFISKESLKDFRDSLTTVHSANTYLSSIRVFLKFVILLDSLEEDAKTEISKMLTIKNKKTAKDKIYKSNLSKDEIQLLIDKAPNKQLKTAIALGYYGGLRISEVTALTAKDIDLKNGLISVLGKGKDEKENVPILPNLLPYLKDFEGFSFGVAQLSRDFNKLLKENDLKYKGNAKVSFHSLRHSIAVSLLKNDVQLEQVRVFLRHSNIATTQKYVVNLEKEETWNQIKSKMF